MQHYAGFSANVADAGFTFYEDLRSGYIEGAESKYLDRAYDWSLRRDEAAADAYEAARDCGVSW